MEFLRFVWQCLSHGELLSEAVKMWWAFTNLLVQSVEDDSLLSCNIMWTNFERIDIKGKFTKSVMLKLKGKWLHSRKFKSNWNKL